MKVGDVYLRYYGNMKPDVATITKIDYTYNNVRFDLVYTNRTEVISFLFSIDSFRKQFQKETKLGRNLREL